MAEGVIQLPSDAAQTGKKQRHRSRVIGANTVYEVASMFAGLPTYYAFADAVVPATSKQHITIFNATGSGVTVAVRELFAINVTTAAVTGGQVRYDVKRATASSAGTTITPVAVDTTNPALPAGVTVRTNGTVTEGSLMYPWLSYTDEDTAVAAMSKAMFEQATNIMITGLELQETILRANNEGLTIKQITAVTSGSIGWLMVFTVDT